MNLLPRINVLDKHVSELIAAGEVVDRPCSVIKELVENSIDAGAKNITVEIQNGGNTFMRVTDDGCGIEKDDIPKAFLRHATSKIEAETDLSSIHTFGFRGEALASVAAVAHVNIITRTENSELGYSCNASDCEIGEVTEAGCPKGTTIVVRDLFYNTPARQKFLKKDISEANAVGNILDKIALSHPDIRFRFIKDGETKLSTYGNGDLLSVISSVYGKEFSANMIKVDYSPMDKNGYSVYGYITAPTATKASRNFQNFYVNMRYVKTSLSAAAVEEAFKGSAMVGKFPGCVLFIRIPFETVDVNVHPAKTEVRFQNDKDVFDLIYYGVKSALNKDDVSVVVRESEHLKPKYDFSIPESEKPKFETLTASEFRKEFAEKETADFHKESQTFSNLLINDIQTRVPQKTTYIYPNIDVSADDEETETPVKYMDLNDGKTVPEEIYNRTPIADQITIDRKPSDDFHYVGEIFKTYIVLESEESVIFVDKHAAHERILYEKLRSGVKAFDHQILLTPITLNMSQDQIQAITENEDVLDKFGFECDDFGNGTLIVRSMPLWLKQSDLTDILSEIADSLIGLKHDITPEKLNSLYANIACRAAIKANNINTEEELKTIIDILIEERSIKYCPHGRPISTEITKTKLEHMFGRIQ